MLLQTKLACTLLFLAAYMTALGPAHTANGAQWPDRDLSCDEIKYSLKCKFTEQKRDMCSTCPLMIREYMRSGNTTIGLDEECCVLSGAAVVVIIVLVFMALCCLVCIGFMIYKPGF
eukprot:m.253670 g.253670  ORF g.253670 m.253670 type:complete len:117 (+) comp16162_c0_seq4:119-469(+)